MKPHSFLLGTCTIGILVTVVVVGYLNLFYDYYSVCGECFKWYRIHKELCYTDTDFITGMEKKITEYLNDYVHSEYELKIKNEDSEKWEKWKQNRIDFNREFIQDLNEAEKHCLASAKKHKEKCNNKTFFKGLTWRRCK